MKTILTLAAVLLLSSCATYNEIQSSAPVLDLDTDKAPAEYTSCLAPKLMEIWPGEVSVIPDGQNTVISVAVPNGHSMMATVTVEPEGRVSLREMSHIDLGSAFKRAREATRSCI